MYFMKKIFTLIAMYFCMAVTAFAAGEVYWISFNGANEQNQEGYFSWNADKHNFNAKYTGTYNGVEYTKGLKMESATKISWSSTAAATVTVVQSTATNDTKYPALDGTTLSTENATEDAANTVRVYTIPNVPAGNHELTRGTGENGILYISVEYTGASMTTLEAPQITVNGTTGEVTIGAVANAKEIRYTTDGATPNATTGEVYAAPFTVADGTIVKAVAIGDDVSFVTSDVTTIQVLLDGVKPVAPVIAQQYGSVGISCETPAATLEYSLDNATWTAYTRTFTLTETKTVYARSTRGGVTSDVASVEVEAVATPSAATLQTITLDMGCFQQNDPVNNVISGTPGTANEGWILTCENDTKTYSAGSDITEDEYTTIKASNGAQNILTIPAGKKIVRATIVSYVNTSSTSTRVSGWKEVAGVEYDYNAVPTQAYTNIEDHKTNPDVRIFPLDCTGTFTFTNTGDQHAFYLVLDVCDANDTATGISDINVENTVNAPVYNISGQQVSKNYKGIVIMNGKKYINK